MQFAGKVKASVSSCTSFESVGCIRDPVVLDMDKNRISIDLHKSGKRHSRLFRPEFKWSISLNYGKVLVLQKELERYSVCMWCFMLYIWG